MIAGAQDDIVGFTLSFKGLPVKPSGYDNVFCHLKSALQYAISDVMTLHHFTEVHLGFGMRKRHPLLKRPK